MVNLDEVNIGNVVVFRSGALARVASIEKVPQEKITVFLVKFDTQTVTFNQMGRHMGALYEYGKESGLDIVNFFEYPLTEEGVRDETSN